MSRRRSPLLTTEIEDYYLGGVTSIVEEIRRCNHYFDEWFFNSIPEDPWTVCATFKGQESPHIHHNEAATFDQTGGHRQHLLNNRDKKRKAVTLRSTLANSMFGYSMVQGNFMSERFGEHLAISAPFEVPPGEFQIDTGAVYIIGVEDAVKGLPAPYAVKIYPSSQPHKSYSMNQIAPFGTVLGKIRLLGEDILIVAHPGASTLYFYLHGKFLFKIFWTESDNTYGGNGTKLVGSAIAIGDVDGDGIPDILVGAPQSDARSVQNGKVFLLSGHQLTAQLKAHIAGHLEDSVIPASKFVINEFSCPESKKLGYENFGSQIAVLDIKDESKDKNVSVILIKAAGLGKVYVYLPDDLKSPFTSLYQGASDDFDGAFRQSLLLTLSDDGLIFVGSSGASYSNCEQCGAVDVYKASLFSGSFSLQKVITLKPRVGFPKPHNFKRFGTQGVLTRRTFFITSPYSHDSYGSIWAIPLNDLDLAIRVNVNRVARSKRMKIKSLPSLSAGGDPHTHFGNSMAATIIPQADDRDYLFVGQPYYNSDETDQDGLEPLVGQVSTFKYMNGKIVYNHFVA